MEANSKTLVIVGLGNPGVLYEMTRHNIGAMVVEWLAREFGCGWKEDRRFNAKIAKISFEGSVIHLLFPLTYMNLSGAAVRRYLDYFKLSSADLLVIADDTALPFGFIRLRGSGTSGGHNGLKSVEESLGSIYYKRLRMGIGHPGEKKLSDYVLEVFSETERAQLPALIKRGAAAVYLLLKEGLPRAMNQINLAVSDERSQKI